MTSQELAASLPTIPSFVIDQSKFWHPSLSLFYHQFTQTHKVSYLMLPLFFSCVQNAPWVLNYSGPHSSSVSQLTVSFRNWVKMSLLYLFSLKLPCYLYAMVFLAIFGRTQSISLQASPLSAIRLYSIRLIQEIRYYIESKKSALLYFEEWIE